MIKFKGINHLAMATGDIDKTIRFWRDLLGMRLVVGIGEPGYRHYFFEISETDMIAFFEWPEVVPVEERDHGYPNKGPVVFDHISFGLESEDGLWKLQDRLNAAGYPVSGVIDHGFIYSMYSWDPNGIPIEFSIDVPGVDVRREPRMLDHEPTVAAKEGPDPVMTHQPAASPTPPNGRRIYPGVGSEYFDGGKKESGPDRKF